MEACAACGARLLDAGLAVVVIASGVTIDARGAGPLDLNRVFSAVSALVGEGQGVDLHAICQELASTKTLDVFDIEVEEAHEFSANNVRVHNCVICQGIARAVPKRGLPMKAYFVDPGSKLQVLLAPAHVNCRCSVQILAFEPSQLEEENNL